MYQGQPYPFCLELADNSLDDWYYSMNFGEFGAWIDMEEVSVLTDPFDPKQNLERFVTGYARPAFELFSELYPTEDEVSLWRRVAFHWNKGLYKEYDPENEDYLALYDEYVARYYVE